MPKLQTHKFKLCRKILKAKKEVQRQNGYLKGLNKWVTFKCINKGNAEAKSKMFYLLYTESIYRLCTFITIAKRFGQMC